MARGRLSLRVAPAPRADIETRASPDDHQSLRLWLRLLACTNLVEGQVRQGLKASYGTTLPRFDLMAQLDRAADGLKMGELSQRMMVTGGNVTGITDMLEKEGLVVREPDAADRRAFRVKLTREGRRQFRRMAAEHERWVVELLDGLSSRQRDQLVELLGVLKSQIGHRIGPRVGSGPAGAGS
jgi:DNA-binding MarR family transcriptional regulator